VGTRRIAHRRHVRVGTERSRRDGGYILVKFAMLLVPLLLMAGLSVDVGYWYNLAATFQKAADAAALAGVVWLPNFELAEDYANEAAVRNGFKDGVGGVEIDVEQTGERRLKVTIEQDGVGSFFWENFGGSTIDLTRAGSAEYILPVKMGSPDYRLGNDPTASGYPTGAPNLWTSISGPATAKADGDPFSTKAGSNPEYRNWGYLYVIDVEAAQVNKTLTLSIYDAGHYVRSSYPNVETADYGTVNTQFEVYKPDDTPLDTLDGLTPTYSLQGKCLNSTPGRFRLASGASSSTYRNKWVELCRWVPPEEGKYIMQVKSSNIPTITDAGNGWNQFSVRVTASSGANPALYTVGDLSLFNNLPGRSGNINANFYLAEIEAKHAGKTLEVSLFDPGDGQSGTYYANIKGPNNSTQACKYKERTATTWTSSASCRITTRSGGSNAYQGKWLDIQVAVPTTYTCTDCWWKVLYEFQNVTSGASPNDRTVWSARVVGDPVHLVEDEAS
jgi:hypothetical protein